MSIFSVIWIECANEIGIVLTRWYVDSSVVLRVVKEGSVATAAWFESAAVGGQFVASKLMELEVLRTLHNNHADTRNAEILIKRFALLGLDDSLADEAAELGPSLAAGDALHIASALRVGGPITVVTHDAQMAVAAQQLGLAVLDPVTDDPTRPPVM